MKSLVARLLARERGLFAGAAAVALACAALGVPVDFVLFGLTLAGVALFHHHTLYVGLTGLGVIVLYKLGFTGFKTGPGLGGLAVHLAHEWVILTNLLGLLLGFALLSSHFEESKVPAVLPRFLPDDWKGGFVLLAEAEVPYEQVLEMDDINSDFGTADVAFVLGANDVVNPLAEQKGSAIYGMPILEVHKARTVMVNKRSMASGYAGLDNPLFYMDKTMMVFGDAKKVVEDMVKAIE